MTKYKSPGRRELKAQIESRYRWIKRGPTTLNAAGQVVSNNRAARRAAR